MEENNAKYPRIIIRKKTLEDMKLSKEISDIIYLFTTPDKDDFYVINQFALLSQLIREDEDACKNLNAEVKKVLADTLDSSVREKFLYLKMD